MTATERPELLRMLGHELAAAQILKERAPEVHGRIAFVFQPAEEAGGGVEGMLRDGLIER